MSELNLIKTVLFNAADLNEALTRLTELGIEYRACSFTDNGFHVSGHDITFWPTSSLRCPLSVCINGNLFDYEDRKHFLAGQSETVVTQVPAGCSAKTDQRPACENPQDCINCPNKHICFLSSELPTETVDNSRFNYVKSYVKIPQLRNILRTERRLKNSRVKGLSS